MPRLPDSQSSLGIHPTALSTSRGEVRSGEVRSEEVGYKGHLKEQFLYLTLEIKQDLNKSNNL